MSFESAIADDIITNRGVPFNWKARFESYSKQYTKLSITELIFRTLLHPVHIIECVLKSITLLVWERLNYYINLVPINKTNQMSPQRWIKLKIIVSGIDILSGEVTRELCPSKPKLAPHSNKESTYNLKYFRFMVVSILTREFYKIMFQKSIRLLE